jgi:hypothetical protein
MLDIQVVGDILGLPKVAPLCFEILYSSFMKAVFLKINLKIEEKSCR